MSEREQEYRSRLQTFLRVKWLRTQRWSYQRIGEMIGTSRQRAHAIVARGWPFPRGPHATYTCAHAECRQPIAMRWLCPRHYALKFRKVVTAGDLNLLSVVARYCA